MGKYQDLFSSEEWQTLRFSLLWVFYAIAEVDGVIDAEEGRTLLSVFGGGLELNDELANELMASAAADPQALMDAIEKDGRGVPMGIKEVAEIVEKNLDAEKARNFKRTLVFLGAVFAKASDEIPGESTKSRVSEAERMAIVTVAAILRLTPDDLVV